MKIKRSTIIHSIELDDMFANELSKSMQYIWGGHLLGVLLHNKGWSFIRRFAV